MSEQQLQKLLKSVGNKFIITVITSAIFGIGGFYGSILYTRWQSKQNSTEIINIKQDVKKKADKEYVQEQVVQLNDDIQDLKKSQNRANELLWEINNKIKN